MANPQHLAMLKQGIPAWNEWRTHTHEPIDLSNADLSAAKLTEVNFSGVNLQGAILKQAKLTGSELNGANLSSANLEKADLRAANLAGATLQGADLNFAILMDAILTNANLAETNLIGAHLNNAKLANANLESAHLNGTNFDHADLSGADLTGVELFRTVFGETNLTGARGLDQCSHTGPSILDVATIAKAGLLPLPFLRGCGLPENLITYLPSLLNQPIQFYSCFISYSTKDQAFADRLYADLQNKGVRCWFAPHDMAPGKKIHEQIDEAIRLHDKLLLILSEHSMNSEWVKTEIANARQRELKEKRQMLFPLSLADFQTLKDWKCFDADTGKDSAREIREYFIPDFSSWKANHDSYQQSFALVVKSLQTKHTTTSA